MMDLFGETIIFENFFSSESKPQKEHYGEILPSERGEFLKVC